MRTIIIFTVQALTVSLALACSVRAREGGHAPAASGSAVGQMNSNDDPFMPSDLPNSLRVGDAASGLNLIAFSLLQKAQDIVLYSTVRNDGATPSCEPGIVTDFFNRSGQLVTSAGSTLLTAQFCQLTTGELIPCLAPGQIAMGASTLPSIVILSDLGSLQHAFPAFTVDGAVLVDALSVDAVELVTSAAGISYQGTLDNMLGTAVSAPSVTIFPTNHAHRPLGSVSVSRTADLAAGSQWSFETDVIDPLSTSFSAYPSATLH